MLTVKAGEWTVFVRGGIPRLSSYSVLLFPFSFFPCLSPPLLVTPYLLACISIDEIEPTSIYSHFTAGVGDAMALPAQGFVPSDRGPTGSRIERRRRRNPSSVKRDMIT